MNNKISKLKDSLILSSLVLMFGCKMPAFVSEVNYVPLSHENIELNKLGNGRVLFVNGDYYCPIITCGKLNRINIKMGDTSFGQINYGEYFIVNIKKGVHEFSLEHKDVFKMSNVIELQIDENTKVISVSPKTFSNKMVITNEIPPSFEYYKEVGS